MTKNEIEKTTIDAVGLYWTVDNNKGLVLGNTYKDLLIGKPDFYVYSAKTNKEQDLMVIKCTMTSEPTDNTIIEVRVDLNKSVHPDYIKAKGNLVLEDIVDIQLADMLKHVALPDKCGLCGIKVKKGHSVNYCCPACYAKIKVETKIRGWAYVPALGERSQTAIRIMQGEVDNTCVVCDIAPASEDANVCVACSGFITQGETLQ